MRKNMLVLAGIACLCAFSVAHAELCHYPVKTEAATTSAVAAPAVTPVPDATAPAAAAPAPAAAAPTRRANKGDTSFMMISTLLVILMTIPGLALFYGGLVRSKNMLSC